MLSTGAWNALLKILEEPPPHVVFMFATTEVQKVPQTILSRVQKFALRKITLDELMARLEQIGKSEGIAADRAAIEIIARRGEGSVRDALSLLDQVIAFAGRKIGSVEVATVLGLSDTAFFARVITLISQGDHAGILEALEEASETGRDFKMLYRDMLNFVRNLLLIAGGANESALAVTPEDLATIKSVAGKFSYTELLRIANLLLRDDETVNKAEHQRLAVEIALLKAATFPRLREVEQVLAAGTSVSSGAPPPSHAATFKTSWTVCRKRGRFSPGISRERRACARMAAAWSSSSTTRTLRSRSSTRNRRSKRSPLMCLAGRFNSSSKHRHKKRRKGGGPTRNHPRFATTR